MSASLSAAAILAGVLLAAGASHGHATGQAAVSPDTSPSVHRRLPDASARQLTIPAAGTAIAVAGTLTSGHPARFVIGGTRGTVMLVHAQTPAVASDARLAVYRLDTGAALRDTWEGPAFWKARLPATLGYLLEVEADTATSFTLEIEVPRIVHLTPSHPSMTVTASAPARSRVAFLLRHSGGQTLTARLTAPDDDDIGIAGLDDGREVLAHAAGAKSFTGALAAGQDYLVRVRQGAAGGEFTLALTLQ